MLHFMTYYVGWLPSQHFTSNKAMAGHVGSVENTWNFADSQVRVRNPENQVALAKSREP